MTVDREASPPDWFWEGEVQTAVARHLAAAGWTVERQADTSARERGVDILAVRGRRKLAVEVKGFPSTTYARGPKAGQPKPTAPTLQARHWFAEALLTSLLTKSANAKHEIALALPDVPRFREFVKATASALEQLYIGVYLVGENATVTRVIDHHRPPIPDRARILLPARRAADWRTLLADPALHWKKGRSAMALAEAWQSGEFPVAVRRVLDESSPALRDLELLLAIPEHKVPLPGGARASQTDLFVLARGSSGLFAMAIEGKVDESFDETVSDWLKRRASEQAKKGGRDEPSAQARARLTYLCGLLQLHARDIGDLRYQLLHRTASALLEAERFRAAGAMMLVHSFSSSDAWFDDFATFARRLGADEPAVDRIIPVGDRGAIELHLGWIRGQH